VSDEEKAAWVRAAIAVIVPIACFATVLPQLSVTPVADIEYEVPLLMASAATVVSPIVAATARVWAYRRGL
jgi:hypothetical protein